MGSSDAEMPEGFKPNDQKTKSFLKRLEYGTNIQSQKASYFFPTTSDFGLSVGYKLNDKSIIGIGASYKLGLGKGWNDIKLSSEGIGLRSFIDWKVKGSFWISGGYEQNYRSAFKNFSQLQSVNDWQRVTTAISSSQGDQISTCFLFSMGRSRGKGCTNLAHRADVATQLVHLFRKLAGVGHLQITRPWQLDLAFDHKPARALAHHVHRVGEEY